MEQRFVIEQTTNGPITRYYVMDTRDGFMVTWCFTKQYAEEWCDYLNSERG